ncbi:MAG: hypothetical protein HY290_32390 [Planctomycetia bacterium]|nr:hypothetical protein [Planctomycetia bacterium]
MLPILIIGKRFLKILLSAGCAVLLLCGNLTAGERLELEAREVGGIRRHEPVSALITLPQAVGRNTPFRLVLDGDPVAAQFRPAGDGEQTAQWWIDFSTILGPFDRHTYVVEYGRDVPIIPESARGHVLRTVGETFVVENAPYITWTIPRDLAGLLRSVDFPPNEHLRPDSPGLVLRDRAGKRYPLGGAGVESRVVRSGTRAVALRFIGGIEAGPLAGVRWTTDLIFPSPVSWVEVVCTLDDREGKVAAQGIELNMALDRPAPNAPTLVDIGAWTQVYAALSQDEIVEIRAAPGPATTIVDGRAKNGAGVHGAGGRCGVFRGRPDKLVAVATNYSDGPDDGTLRPLTSAPEGWLHVMDRKRCLALAIDQFARRADERLTATADGAVRAWREYPEGAAGDVPPAKSLRCWLHFVHYPPQFSAATSPRMMQTPPEVRLKAR